MDKFEEKQRFTQWWLWLILLAVCSIPYVPIMMGLDTQTDQWLGLLAMSILLFFIVGLLFLIQLKTKVDEVGIHYQFIPFHFKQKTILWQEIKSAEVRKYEPLKEYGGWGIKGYSKKNRAYNVKGNMGLQIVLKTGDKILFGTQKEEELRSFLKSNKKQNKK
ncbi:MAG: hypothetical protein ACOVP1_05790 [Bacteroidia bacterium]